MKIKQLSARIKTFGITIGLLATVSLVFAAPAFSQFVTEYCSTTGCFFPTVISPSVNANSLVVNGNTTLNGNVTVGGMLTLPAGQLNPSIVERTGISASNPGKKPTDYFYDSFYNVLTTYLTEGTQAGALNVYSGATVTGSGSGVGVLTTGTTATGGSNLMWGYASYLGLNSAVRVKAGFWLPTISQSGNSYTVYVGSFQVAGVVGPQGSPAFWLTYTDTVNSGAFQICSGTAPASNCINTGVTVAANTYYLLDYTMTVTAVNTATNPVNWAIYAAGSTTPAASGTANIGFATTTGNGSTAPLAATIIKNSGTTACTLSLDFWEFTGAY